METDNTYPYKNLALEEYLTRNVQSGELILFLWQNKKSVIIGRNQNIWKECNLSALKNDGGYPVRRLSGGGAVFHDEGNLNFTFCSKSDDFDISSQSDVILMALESLGISAKKTGRNDLEVQERKISGSAYYKSGDFRYHHGTILLDADVSSMMKYLSPDNEKLKSKGVDSIKSRILNLKKMFPKLTIELLKKNIKSAFEKKYGLCCDIIEEKNLPKDEIYRLQQKFESEEWIYNRKIYFTNDFNKRFPWGDIHLCFSVNKGIVENVKIFSDALDADFIIELSEAFKGCAYSIKALSEALNKRTTVMLDDFTDTKKALSDIKELLEDNI